MNTSVAISLLAVVLVAMVYQVYFYFRYIKKGGAISTPQPKTNHEELPPVSVIVCARNEYNNLQEYLPILLSQDYPTYEVIIVDDSSEDDTEFLLERLKHQYVHLYHTFVPRGARVLSSKKLALTIGLKAAHHEHILLTDADCRPESKYWIREMMQGFANADTEMVLGFSPYFEKKGLLNHLISYDTLFTGLQYTGMARAGFPYMGVGRNLAYKRSTFFDMGGFKGLLNNQAGDDDLFVNRVATKKNTSVVCTRDSLIWSAPKTTWHEWLHQKRRHLSVSPQYNLKSKCRLTIEPISRALFYASIIASFIWGGWIVAAIAATLLVLRWIMQMVIINISAHRLGIRKVGMGLFIYDILLPLITLYIIATHRITKKPLYW
ncbi:MAG: glycosyltransferase [Paludibacteraceae bacterium]|nr:glycosyltransferase [Paludibacteraceae bacterium]